MSTKKESSGLNGWDEAIKDAKRRIEKLQTVIAVCEEKKSAGEPWPGSEGYAVTQSSATHN